VGFTGPTCHLTRLYKGLSRRLINAHYYPCSVHAEAVLASYNGTVRNLTRRAIATHDLASPGNRQAVGGPIGVVTDGSSEWLP
jgi:hypothetical protein